LKDVAPGGAGWGVYDLGWWNLGREFPIPDTEYRVQILENIPRARAIYGPATGPAAAIPIGAEPDPLSSTPAMRVLVRWRDRDGEAWLLGEIDGRETVLPLGPLSGQSRAPLLKLSREGPTKNFRSELVVLKQGTPVVEGVVRINHPLHYGGYHVHIVATFLDADRKAKTVLLVKSDTGLYVVYAGLALLCLGMFWTCWGSLVRDRLSRGEGGA
jgi:hypothetical protein